MAEERTEPRMTGAAQKNVLFYSLCFAAGFLISIGPLVWSLPKDPFDKAINYAVWGGGFFLASIVLSLVRPERMWRSAFYVALGLPGALVFAMAFISGPSNLFPISILFSLVVGLIPSWAGAIIGKMVKLIGDGIRGRK